MLVRLAGLARQSRLHGKFFHVIAKLIFSVFYRRAEIPANRASPASRAGLVEGLALSAEMAVQPGITRGGPARLRLNLEAVV